MCNVQISGIHSFSGQKNGRKKVPLDSIGIDVNTEFEIKTATFALDRPLSQKEILQESYILGRNVITG